MSEIENIFKQYKKNRLALWADVIKNLGPEVVIAEIGVWKGNFCKHMLENCPNIKKYYLIDPWRHLDSWNKPFNVENDRFRKIFLQVKKDLEIHNDKIEILRGTTREVINRIPDGSLDLVYIDGDHTEKGIKTDLELSFPKVKSGGIIGGDDFVNNVNQHGPRYDKTMVKPVVIDYCKLNKLKLIHSFSQFSFLKK